MKVTRKLRNKILDTVSEVTLQLLLHHCPEYERGAPESWAAETKEKFDIITDVGSALERRLNAMLCAQQ